eukprot:gene3177-248_t
MPLVTRRCTLCRHAVRRSLDNIESVFRYLSLVQLTLMFTFYCVAACYWHNFSRSQFWVRTAWLVSFLIPFLGVNFPWLAYLPPEWIIADTCKWALGLAQGAYFLQFNETVDLGVSTIGARLTPAAMLLAERVARHQCAYLSGGADLSRAGLPGIPPELISPDACAARAAAMLEPTVVHLWAVYVPSIGMMLLGWVHMLPTVLGFVFGMTRGLKVLKLAVPAARLPTWLLVSITTCSAPILCFIFTTFVCLVGTIPASCSSLFL